MRPITFPYRPWPGLFAIIVTWGLVASVDGAPRTWIGGNADWNATNANWNPANEPDPADEAIFNTPNTVKLANATEDISALTLTNGISLSLNGNDMNVNGLVQISNAGSDLTIDGNSAQLTADLVTLNNGGRVVMDGGVLVMIEETGNGLFDINSGTSVVGRGGIVLNDSVAAGTRLLVNDGTLSASSVGFIVLGGLPSAGTLTIDVFDDADARVDLDGDLGNGVVNAFANQTLIVNATLADAFSGDMNLFQESTVNIRDAWSMDVGTIDIDNGFIDNVFPVLDVPAGVAHLAGGGFTHSGGTITIVDADGTLQFDATYNQTGGTVSNNGLVVFNANATIGAAATFNMPGNNASMTVNPGVTVTVNQPNFNLDGNGSASNRITVQTGGLLDLNLGAGGDRSLNGTITIDGGRIDVSSSTGDWEINAGTFHLNSTASNSGIADGQALFVGSDTGSLDANLIVGGTGTSRIDTTSVTFQSDADVNIAAGATLRTGNANFNSVNGVENAEFTGAGTWILAGTNTFNETTTINMVGGTVDLDNSADVFVIGGNDTFVNANLTINAATLATYGKAGLGFVSELNIADTRVLTVNLDDPNGEWTVNSAGVINYNGNAGAVDTFLAGSDLNLNGILNVTGDGASAARLDLGGTTNILTAGRRLRLAGGSLADPNRLVGGTVTGPGILNANAAVALNGFGTLNSDLDFDGTATLLADDGTLTVNGSFLDMGTLGTADADGVLHVSNPWNTNNADAVRLQGGRLEGATITNGLAGGIDGFGTVTAVLLNNTRVDAEGGTLVLDNPSTDYDGLGTGTLHAANLATLELRDNALFPFTGSAVVDAAATLFANGFELRMAAGSSLTMTKGTFKSTNSTDFNGAVISTGGTSTINAPSIDFTAISSVTLTGSLRLESTESRILVGASFAGGGELINGVGRLRLQDGVNLPVLVVNDAMLELSASINTAGQVTGLSFQQSSSGQLEIDLGGTGLNDFDFLALTGQAKLDGVLSVSNISGFHPAEGNTFTILSAPGGVSGAFTSIIPPALDPGLVMNVIYNPTNVMLRIDRTALLACDLNSDGAADAADAGIMFGNWGGAGLGDCNHDGIVDAADAGLLFAEWTGDAAPSSVPEPTGSAVAVLALFGLARNVPGRRSK